MIDQMRRGESSGPLIYWKGSNRCQAWDIDRLEPWYTLGTSSLVWSIVPLALARKTYSYICHFDQWFQSWIIYVITSFIGDFETRDSDIHYICHYAIAGWMREISRSLPAGKGWNLDPPSLTHRNEWVTSSLKERFQGQKVGGRGRRWHNDIYNEISLCIRY